MRYFLQRLRRFRRDDDGSIAIETMLILPILIWCYLGVFVFFDAYRAQSINIRAANTIADALSRETGYINDTFIDSLYTLQRFVANTSEASGLRITVFLYRGDEEDYIVRWSQGRNMPPMTTAQLADMSGSLPALPDDTVAILVESTVQYSPTYDVGLSDFEFYERAIAPPRFAGQLCWNSVVGGDSSTATC